MLCDVWRKGGLGVEQEGVFASKYFGKEHPVEWLSLSVLPADPGQGPSIHSAWYSSYKGFDALSGPQLVPTYTLQTYK